MTHEELELLTNGLDFTTLLHCSVLRDFETRVLLMVRVVYRQ